MLANNGAEKFFLNCLYSSIEVTASRKIPSAPSSRYSPHLFIASSIPSEAIASVLAIIKKDSSIFESSATFNLSFISDIEIICLLGLWPHLLSNT